jgi:hypothetical protein
MTPLTLAPFDGWTPQWEDPAVGMLGWYLEDAGALILQYREPHYTRAQALRSVEVIEAVRAKEAAALKAHGGLWLLNDLRATTSFDSTAFKALDHAWEQVSLEGLRGVYIGVRGSTYLSRTFFVMLNTVFAMRSSVPMRTTRDVEGLLREFAIGPPKPGATFPVP